MRGSLEAFASQLLGKGVTRTNALEALVISGWVRGLSMRDIEAALAETLGPDATLSKSTASVICKAIQASSTRSALPRRHREDVVQRADQPGAAVADHQQRRCQPARRHRAQELVTGDLEHLIACLAFPKAHWKRIRHSNPISVDRLYGGPVAMTG